MNSPSEQLSTHLGLLESDIESKYFVQSKTQFFPSIYLLGFKFKQESTQYFIPLTVLIYLGQESTHLNSFFTLVVST